MRYSQEKKKLYIELIASIISTNPTISARAVFRKLSADGYHLGRSYVNRLVSSALNKLGDEEKDKRLNLQKHTEWNKHLEETIKELGDIKKKLEYLLWTYPEDLKQRY